MEQNAVKKHSGFCKAERALNAPRKQSTLVVARARVRESSSSRSLGQIQSHQLINHSSGNFEHYTPCEIVAAAKLAMGGLDLDPASCAAANARINAPAFFSVKDDGLSQPWFGKVWMNHPFGKGRNHLWITKLISEFESKKINAACCITFASTSEAWFKPPLRFPQCFLWGRTNYFLPDGSHQKGVTKGSVVTYLGPQPRRFYEAFRTLGEVKIPFMTSDSIPNTGKMIQFRLTA